MCGGGSKKQAPVATPEPPKPKPEYSYQDDAIRQVKAGTATNQTMASFGSELGTGGN